MLKTNDFDYELPAELIAQQPARPRDASRLMRLERSGGEVRHSFFRQLPELLMPGDLLIFNNTYVVPARFCCFRPSGGRIEGLFLRELDEGRWLVMLKNAGRCRPGEELRLVKWDAGKAILDSRQEAGVWQLSLRPAMPARPLLELIGQPPLPPYIRRDAGQASQADRLAYQTVYAQQPGAVAAPTAGLHFTQPVLEALARRGVESAYVTLHVGMGTFASVKAGSVQHHKMHAEWYELSAAAAEAINRAKQQGRRVLAVGTTSVRVLETVAAQAAPQPADSRGRAAWPGLLRASAGWTDIFIYPPAQFRIIDGLLTNFHLPQSTLLMLVAAFCAPGGADGIATILSAYRQAIAQRYRFYSYGDAMLIV